MKRPQSPFYADAVNRPDYTTHEGAKLLRDKIATYWKKQNLTPLIRTTTETYCAKTNAPRTDIRSDMVDGLPRRWTTPQKREDASHG